MDSLILVLHKALGYLETIRFSDVVDIAIIAYLIYKLLRFAKAQAGQVLKGIAALIILMWAASLLDLHVLNYLLTNALEIGFLAIIVVFQPEIRHFLEQMGSSGLTSVFGRHEANVDELERAIDETVEAYAAMSKSKTGALTVFERGSILDDCIKTGTALDASVSAELLKNIFFVKAPLHDGAVIVRAGRIVGAGCVLPLSSNTNISKELGMRHRAGIGATEHTDALAVICSEETGSISVATNGTLRRHLAPETLRRMLRNELLPQEKLDEKKDLLSLSLATLRESWRGRKGEQEEHEDVE
ncbi:MAG: diadenylate cyclase CdaA [Clostridiales bacterium]|nr:diadenylate cyclase CdaA [Clostridiales bacterium]